MELKIDKDTLIKQRFWILLGMSVLLLLVALLMLPSSVGSEVETKQKDYNGKKDSLAKISSVKNPKWVDEAKKADDFVESKKNKVWEQAWLTQKDLMTWPARLQSFATKYAYFGDPIEQVDRSQFGGEYQTQIYAVWSLVQPLEANGSGVVQFPGGDYESVLQLEKQWPEVPSNVSIWLAQEDLWVKRELLRIVREANDSVARFKEGPAPATEPAAAPAKPQPKPAAEPVKSADTAADKKPAKPVAAKPKAPASDPRHKVYHNAYWELDLTLRVTPKNERIIGGTIKNVSNRRQARYGLMFDVFLSQPTPETPPLIVPVSGLPLAAGETAKLDEVMAPQKLAGDALYGVEQLLTWRTAPVKRIDAVRLGYHSSRTAGKRLVAPQWIQKEKDAAEQPSAGADPSGSGVGAGTGSKFTSMQAAMGGGGGASRDSAGTARYTDANEQVRHMPVAMQVVITEDAMPDFLAAFANSTLRIQTLQYHWEHSHDKIQPQTEEESPTTTGKGQPASKKPGPNQGQLRIRQPNQPKMGGPGPGAMSGMLGGGESGAPLGGAPQNAMAAQAMGGQQQRMNMGGGVTTQGMMGMMMGGGGKFSGRPPVAGGFPGKGGVAQGPVEEEEEQELVSLSVYGLASLYERYPPKKPEQTAADKPAP
jgi:hypothetical protein